MAMLTHDFERPLHAAARPPQIRADAARARLEVIKRVCLVASTLLFAGAGLAAVIALKTAIYFSRFHL